MPVILARRLVGAARQGEGPRTLHVAALLGYICSVWPLRWPIWPGWWRDGSPGRAPEPLGTARPGKKRRRRWRERLAEVVRERPGSHRHRVGRALVADAAAFLRGDLAEVWEHEVGYVPAWVWTNRLAHGTEAELRADSEGSRAIGGASGDRWRRARAFLAGEVLESAANYGSLSALQRDVLVPLELGLSSSTKAVSYSLAEWVASVESALREASQHRSSGRGS
jgi:hypothetical protein